MCVDRYGCNLVDTRPILIDTLPILKSIARRTCPKKGVFRFRFFFFVDIFENVIPSFRCGSIPVDKKDRHRTC